MRGSLAGAAAVVAILMLLPTATLEFGPGRTLAHPQAAVPGRDSALPPPLAASTPNEDLITFLRSPIGVVGGGLLVIVSGALAAATFVPYMQTRTAVRCHRSKKRRRRAQEADADVAKMGLPYQAWIAAVIAAGCLLLPLIFTIAHADVFALPKTLGLWLLASVVTALLVAGVLRGARPLLPGPIDTAVVLFVLLNAAATLTSADPEHSLFGERLQYQGLLSMTAYLVLFIAARYAMTGAVHVRVLAFALVVSGVLVSAYAVVQQIGLDPLWAELFKGRVFSTMGQANALGAVLATCLVMAMPLAAVLGGMARRILVLGATLIAMAFLLTFSRGAYLGLAAGGLVTAAVLLRGLDSTTARRYLGRAALATLAGLLALAVLSVAWQPAGDLVGRVAARAAMIVDLDESSNRIRLDLWTVSLHMTADRPFLGTGPDSYVLEFPRHRDDVLPADRAQHLAQFRPESPHSVYLAIASGAGIPALGAFLVVVGGSLWLGIKAASLRLGWGARLAIAGLLAAATIQLVTNAFVTGEPASFAIWCAILGALAGLGGSPGRQPISAAS